ncbi:hypothetical protein ACIGW8_21995 [Streptomyces sioyaensis]|uniref:hypothetical protein n=1 Tax=Streptomyces sioyaensis TaxID=67364 RepID=UPI0037D589F4
MATTPVTPDEANERIRRFMAARAGRPLWSDEQARYEQLLAEWSAAVQGHAAAPA